MQVILPDEQIHQLQLLISRLIENEIKNKKIVVSKKIEKVYQGLANDVKSKRSKYKRC